MVRCILARLTGDLSVERQDEEVAEAVQVVHQLQLVLVLQHEVADGSRLRFGERLGTRISLLLTLGLIVTGTALLAPREAIVPIEINSGHLASFLFVNGMPVLPYRG